jgi:hypothetical protein
MQRDFDEKRDSIRVEVDCAIRFKPKGAEQEEHGKLANLSGRGMMFISANELSVDSEVEVQIEPQSQLSGPLHAMVRVVRAAKQRRGDGYEIGALIIGVLDD